MSKTAVFNTIENSLPGSRDLLINDVQPYLGGLGEDLFALHRLDILDKHRQILVTMALATVGPIFISSDNGSIADIRRIIFNPKEPQALLTYGMRGKITVKQDVHATLEIGFDQAGFFETKPVSQSLVHLSSHVTNVINLFAGLL
jgi:hypothetical protein